MDKSKLSEELIKAHDNPFVRKVAKNLNTYPMPVVNNINNWLKEKSPIGKLRNILKGAEGQKAQPKKSQAQPKASGDSVKEASSYPHNPPSAPYRG